MNSRELVSVESIRMQLPLFPKVEPILLEYPNVEVGLEQDKVLSLNLPFHKTGQEALCKLLDLPAKFYHRSNPEVRSTILKQALHSTPQRFQLVISRDQIIDVISPTAMYHSAVEVLDVVQETLQSHNLSVKGISDFNVCESDYEASFVTEKSDTPATRVGEPTHAGINLSWETIHKEDRAVHIKVAACLYTLRCTNGAISPEEFSFNVADTNGDFKTVLANTILEAASFASTKFLGDFVNLDSKKVSDPAQFISHLVEELRLGKSKLDLLLAQLPSLPAEHTAYDLVNMVTHLGNDEKPSSRRHLQLLGGHLTKAVTQNRCRTCYNKLSQ